MSKGQSHVLDIFVFHDGTFSSMFRRCFPPTCCILLHLAYCSSYILAPAFIVPLLPARLRPLAQTSLPARLHKCRQPTLSRGSHSQRRSFSPLPDISSCSKPHSSAWRAYAVPSGFLKIILDLLECRKRNRHVISSCTTPSCATCCHLMQHR